MPIINQAGWEECQKNNTDPYGNACVEVAREVMRLLDVEVGPIDPHNIINRADDNVKAGGITGFMVGMVASIVSQCHSRGQEFRKVWNAHYNIPESEKGVANPAILVIKDK